MLGRKTLWYPKGNREFIFAMFLFACLVKILSLPLPLSLSLSLSLSNTIADPRLSKLKQQTEKEGGTARARERERAIQFEFKWQKKLTANNKAVFRFSPFPKLVLRWERGGSIPLQIQTKVTRMEEGEMEDWGKDRGGREGAGAKRGERPKERK